MSSPQAGGFMAVGDRLESPSFGDRLFFIAVILMCYSQWLFPGADKESGAGSPLANALWLCIHLFAIGYGFANSKLRRDLTHSLLPLTVFLALVCLSPLWSVEPLISARRAFELVGTTAVAYYFVRRLGFRGLVETLTIAIALAAVMSLTLILFFPAVGVSSEDFDNAWQGMYNHKNALGPAMLLGIVTVGCLFQASRGLWRVLTVTILPIFFVLLVGSKTAGAYTSALAIAIVVPFLVWSRATQKSGPLKIVALIVGTSIVIAVAVAISGFDLDDALLVFGKEPTLTGRTDLWRLVLEAIAERLPLGYGYADFWGSQGPAATLIYPGISNHWEPESAHNGFLEVGLNLGLIGETLFAIFLLTGLRRSWQVFWRSRDLISLWPLCALLTVVLTNLSEATFIVYNQVDWIMLATVCFLTAEALEPATVQIDLSSEDNTLLPIASKRLPQRSRPLRPMV